MADDLTRAGTKGSDITVVTRAKTGNVEYIRDREVIKEVDPQKRTVARILIEPTESGIRRSKRASTQREVQVSRQLQEAQEKVNLASKMLGEAPARVVGTVDPRTETISKITLRRNGKSFTPEKYQEILRQKAETLKRTAPKLQQALVMEELGQAAPKPLVRSLITGEPIRKPENLDKIISKNKKWDAKVIKEFLPFVNEDSKRAYAKITKGKAKNLTFTEGLNVLFDVASIATLGTGTLISQGAKTVGKGIVKVGGVILRKGKVPIKLAKLTTKKKGTIKKLTKLPVIGKTASIDFAVSVINDLGWYSRTFNSAKELYQVDEKLLKNSNKEVGVKNNEEMLRDYNGFVANELRDKNLNWRDYANFVGITTGSRGQIISAQNKYLAYLQSRGIKRARAIQIMANLENMRRARVVGQLVGLTKIEISSDKLVNKLISQGLGAKKAISIGVAREAVSTIVSEAFVDKGNIQASDFFLATLLGVPYSLFASKKFGKVIKVSSKAMKRNINKLANASAKKLTSKRTNKYFDKVIKQSAKLGGKKLSKTELLSIGKQYSPVEKKKIAKAYIKTAIILTRQRSTKAKFKSTFFRKLDKFVKDPMVNLYDPFEFAGDVVQDLSEAISKKIGRTIKKAKVKPKAKIKPKKRVKVKTKVKAKVKAKKAVKAKAKARIRQIAKAKAITKARSVAKAKQKAKEKARAKAKPRPKPKPKEKARPAPRPAPKPKPKPRAKAKPKPRPRVKIFTITGPSIKLKKTKKPGERLAYNLDVWKGKTKKTITVKLPKNRAKNKAIDLYNQRRIDKVRLTPIGYTKQKDVTTIKKITRRK